MDNIKTIHLNPKWMKAWFEFKFDLHKSLTEMDQRPALNPTFTEALQSRGLRK